MMRDIFLIAAAVFLTTCVHHSPYEPRNHCLDHDSKSCDRKNWGP